MKRFTFFTLLCSLTLTLSTYAAERVSFVGDCKLVQTFETEAHPATFVSYKLSIKTCDEASRTEVKTFTFQEEKAHLSLCNSSVSVTRAPASEGTAFSCDELNGYLVKNARTHAHDNALQGCEARRKLEMDRWNEARTNSSYRPCANATR